MISLSSVIEKMVETREISASRCLTASLAELKARGGHFKGEEGVTIWTPLEAEELFQSSEGGDFSPLEASQQRLDDHLSRSSFFTLRCKYIEPLDAIHLPF